MTVKAEHLGGDRYRVRIYAGPNPTNRKGRQIGKNFRAKNQREADRLAPRHEADLRDRVEAIAEKRGTVTELAEAWLQHRENQGDSITTITRERYIVDQIVKGLGMLPVDRLTARQVDAWYATLRTAGGRTEATIHHYHRVLRAILRQGMRWDMVDKVATEKVTAPKASRPQVQPPTTDMLAALLADATPDLRLAAGLAAQTGLRRGELVGLRWSDLDDLALHVRRSVVEVKGRMVTKLPKSGEGRTVDLMPATVAALRRHRVELEARAARFGGCLADDGPILADIATACDGTIPRRPGWLSLAWSRLCARHGVKIRIHDLRHYHATLLIGRGMDVVTVRDRLGHAQASTTLNVYSHALAGEGARAAQIAADDMPL